MNLHDVNVLVNAFRPDGLRHEEHRAWLESELTSGEAWAVSEQILAAVVRLVTHARIFARPTPLPSRDRLRHREPSAAGC